MIDLDAGEIRESPTTPIAGRALRSALEAILLVVDQPTSEVELAAAVGATADDVATTLAELAAELDAGERGVDLRRVADGWRYYTRAAYSSYVERFVRDSRPARLSQAALETLAVIAYQQPVSRARIAAVRGVAVDGVVRTLLTRQLITEVGTEPVSGGILYATTPLFCEHLGLESIDDLPPLSAQLPDASVLDDVVER